MKRLSFPMAVVLLSLLVKHGASDEHLKAVLTTWPQGTHFYWGEPIVLTCEVKGSFSEVWIYSWFIHNLSTPATPSPEHRVNSYSYTISAVTAKDSGSYWCAVQKKDTNYTLLSNHVSLTVTADSPTMSLEVHPDSSQHLKGEMFSLHCSSKNGEWAGWELRRLRGTVLVTGCSQMEGKVSEESPKKCIFMNATVRMSGLYWCESPDRHQRSKTVRITVSDSDVILVIPNQIMTEGSSVTLVCKTNWFNSLNQTSIYKDGVKFMNDAEVTIRNLTKANEGYYKCADNTAAVESPDSWLSVRVLDHPETHSEEGGSSGLWLGILCATVVILLLIPLILLLVPSLRRRIKLFPTKAPRVVSAQQEMPQTKQDVTEIQWDLAWMEMANLLDKQHYPGS